MTEKSTPLTEDELAAAGLPDEQIKLALKTSADLLTLLEDLPPDTDGLRLRDIYESEISS